MELFDRYLLARTINPQGRNFYEVFGYPEIISVRDYRKAFERGDIAETVVSAKPEVTWGGVEPYVRETDNYKIETEFEKEYDKLIENDDVNLYPTLERADIISGIGRYGGLFLGWDDGLDFDKPVKKGSKIVFLETFAEDTLLIKELENAPTSKRYGLPLFYEGTFASGKLQEETKTKTIHWTRVIHLADNRIDSKIYGVPRLKKVFNRILDLHKVLGVDAESFWLGAYGGLAFEADPEAVIEDKEAMTAEIDKYTAGLQRYLRLQGIKTKELKPSIHDPASHVLVQLQLISAQTRIPLSILMGSGRGELSSSNDFKLWVNIASKRRLNYAEPFILRPFINRLIEFGGLPKPERYSVSWHDSNITVQKEQLDSARVFTDAMRMYVEGGGFHLIPSGNFLEDVLKVPADKIELYKPADAEVLKQFKKDSERKESKIDDSSFKDVVPEEKKISE